WITLICASLSMQLSFAQQHSQKAARIGILMSGTDSELFRQGLRQTLRERGYVDGQNLTIEWRAANGRRDRAQALAAELVRLKMDVIVARQALAAQSAKDV